MKNFIFLFLILILFVFQSGCTSFIKIPKDTVYASFGDCLAEGAGAQVHPVNKSFASLTASYLNKLYPNTHLALCGVGGSTTQSYVTYLPPFLEKIAQSNQGPLARATLLIGINDLTTIYEGCLSCTYSATYNEGVTASFAYKSEVQTIITNILKFSPSCKVVLCTIPDPNNDGKGTHDPFKPLGLIKEFNKRIFELGESNKLPVADIYTALIGHPEWFVQNDVHPNEAGHAVIALVVEAAFEGKAPPTPLQAAAIAANEVTAPPNSHLSSNEIIRSLGFKPYCANLLCQPAAETRGRQAGRFGTIRRNGTIGRIFIPPNTAYLLRLIIPQ